ncbi:C10 family peptidase [Porphyromonas gulae]|uniref:C10 family peptidase n=1 Tax=Porphyromonas gulae TaxID=111105 RepID=UPI0006915649|nr:C10 family peptidase [Porphyromonas gulae]
MLLKYFFKGEASGFRSLFFSLLFIAIHASTIEAQSPMPDDERVAWEYARRLYPERETLSLSRAALPAGIPASAFNIGDREGFVLVSSGTSAPTQILGYSREGRFDYEPAPPALKALLSIHSDASDDGTRGSSYNPTGPLLSTKWGQNAPFNLLTPLVNGSQSPTGCGATSMAQVVAHYRYPEKATGQIDYTTSNSQIAISMSLDTIPLDWDNMIDTYEEGAYSTLEAKAVANLMLACGVGMQMNYGAGGSSAYIHKLDFCLRRYFGYESFSRNQVVHQVPQDEWHAYIAADMERGLPIIYLANTNGYGGHIFVLDGIDAEGRIHINWGWKGYADGYYSLGFFNPQSQKRGYNDNAIMITNIRPAIEEEIDENILSWSTKPFLYMGENKKMEYAAAHLYTATDLAPYEGKSIEAIEFFPGEQQCAYRLCIWGDASRQELLFEQEVTGFKAGDPFRVQLSTPFVIPSGKDLYIGYTADASKGYPMGIDAGPAVLGKGDLYVMNPSEGAPFASINRRDTKLDLNFYLRAYLKGSNAIGPIGSGYRVYPNPASDHITVEYPQSLPEGQTIYLFDNEGRVVAKARTSATTVRMDLHHLPAGVYFLHDGTMAEKIVKR